VTNWDLRMVRALAVAAIREQIGICQFASLLGR
jgi:hypothetical protein